MPNLAKMVLKAMVIENKSALSQVLSLLELDLTCNDFTQLPAALSHLSTLQTLLLNDNIDIQLENTGLDALAALPSLQSLDLVKTGPALKILSVWLASSAIFSMVTHAANPQLDLRLRL